MKARSNIAYVFTLIILLLIVQGGFSLVYLKKIASQVENLYLHPYTVSNAARNININLVSMHRYMKDVALAENPQKIKLASTLVDEHEKLVLKNFDLIFDRYLGDRRDIRVAYEAFIDWKVIRDEVIFLKTKGNDIRAANITRLKGADHVALLNQEIQKLIDFADNKAKLFLGNAVEAKSRSISIITILLITTVIASIITAFYAVRRLNSVQIDIKSRMYLIDQNILMAKLDKSGVVLDISSHLCRYFGIRKKNIIGKQVDFFIKNHGEGGIQADDVFKIASTGKTWEGDVRRVAEAGSVQWIHSTVHPELNDDYEVCGYTNIIYDITDSKAVEELSITDTLTGLNNRRFFEQVIKKEVEISNRNNTFLTFAVIDIDFFKNFNDSYGHPAGDNALRKVALVFKQALKRPNDFVFRLGGEEFGIIFSGLDLEKSIALLEHICLQVEQLKIPHNESKVNNFVTVSAGAYVSLDNNITTSNDLYVYADEALYEAKVKRNNLILRSSG